LCYRLTLRVAGAISKPVGQVYWPEVAAPPSGNLVPGQAREPGSCGPWPTPEPNARASTTHMKQAL